MLFSKASGLLSLDLASLYPSIATFDFAYSAITLAVSEPALLAVWIVQLIRHLFSTHQNGLLKNARRIASHGLVMLCHCPNNPSSNITTCRIFVNQMHK